jgi:hypothetical protein
MRKTRIRTVEVSVGFFCVSHYVVRAVEVGSCFVYDYRAYSSRGGDCVSVDDENSISGC